MQVDSFDGTEEKFDDFKTQFEAAMGQQHLGYVIKHMLNTKAKGMNTTPDDISVITAASIYPEPDYSSEPFLHDNAQVNNSLKGYLAKGTALQLIDDYEVAQDGCQS